LGPASWPSILPVWAGRFEDDEARRSAPRGKRRSAPFRRVERGTGAHHLGKVAAALAPGGQEVLEQGAAPLRVPRRELADAELGLGAAPRDRIPRAQHAALHDAPQHGQLGLVVAEGAHCPQEALEHAPDHGHIVGEGVHERALGRKGALEGVTRLDDAELNPKASSIKGVICGHRVEEIENPLTRKVRYLDKLVDELARGRQMEKILRS